MINPKRHPPVYLGICLVILVSCGRQPDRAIDSEAASAEEPEAVSLLGKTLFPPEPSERILAEYQKHKNAYESDPQDVENIIWYGRFTAYKGKHNDAIDIYTQAIGQFPEDPRLYRHRGHRYITIRKFDLAIRDFEFAASLIQGTPNEIEPDGMPNARNIPVSTLHGNIWYHLGLAYYLTHDMENALRAYRNCLASSSNSDNLVSSTNWLYMILRRMGQKEEAEKYLEPITGDLDVIENHDYHRVCLFYKGELGLEDLTGNQAEGPGSDAVNYAVGNWYFYNGERDKARAVFEQILEKKSWGSFGFIAAESQYAREFAK
jgi:tetratricopeptide (TPR) repeat protein